MKAVEEKSQTGVCSDNLVKNCHSVCWNYCGIRENNRLKTKYSTNKMYLWTVFKQILIASVINGNLNA